MSTAALQDNYILSNLGVIRGMLNEIDARRNKLRQQLRTNPNKASEINKELGCLEGEMDAVMFTLDFIEQFPVAAA